MAKIQPFSSLLGCSNSFRWAFRLALNFFWVFLSPRLRHPAAFVEELANDDDVVAKDILGHLHPVDLDVWREILPPSDRVLVDGPVVGGSLKSFKLLFRKS